MIDNTEDVWESFRRMPAPLEPPREGEVVEVDPGPPLDLRTLGRPVEPTMEELNQLALYQQQLEADWRPRHEVVQQRDQLQELCVEQIETIREQRETLAYQQEKILTAARALHKAASLYENLRADDRRWRWVEFSVGFSAALLLSVLGMFLVQQWFVS